MRWILDTDVVVAAIRRNPLALREQLQATSPDDLAISTITVAELVYGAAKSRTPGRTRAVFEHFLSPYEILSFDRVAAEHHGRIRYDLRHQPIGERDLMIAAIALGAGATVATGNVREFGRVAGLRSEDWLQ